MHLSVHHSHAVNSRTTAGAWIDGCQLGAERVCVCVLQVKQELERQMMCMQKQTLMEHDRAECAEKELAQVGLVVF